jgi:hypothetical protein
MKTFVRTSLFVILLASIFQIGFSSDNTMLPGCSSDLLLKTSQGSHGCLVWANGFQRICFSLGLNDEIHFYDLCAGNYSICVLSNHGGSGYVSNISISGSTESYYVEINDFNGSGCPECDGCSGQGDLPRKHESEIPHSFGLQQNFPNPFNPTTNIDFSIPNSSDVSLKIYDITGTLVKSVFEGNLEAGSYDIEINASSWASGVYFYTLIAGDFVQTKKMIMTK